MASGALDPRRHTVWVGYVLLGCVQVAVMLWADGSEVKRAGAYVIVSG